MVKRYKVWICELIELEPGDEGPSADDENCATVVLAADYDALALAAVDLEEKLEMEVNDDRGVL